MNELTSKFNELVDCMSELSPLSTPTEKSVLVRLSLLHNEFLKSYVQLRNPLAVFNDMPGTVDGKLVSSNKKKGRVGLSIYLENFDLVAILPGHDFYTNSNDFNDDEVLPSLHIPSLNDDKKGMVLSRLNEGKSGTPMRLYNMIPSVIIALGDKIDSIQIRTCFGFLKWISKMWGESGDDECDDPPYGSLRVTVDSMSPKKVYSTINLAYIISDYLDDVIPYLESKGVNTNLLCHQMLSGMCKSPIGFTFEVKGPIGFAYMHTSVMSGDGTNISLINSPETVTYQKYDLNGISVNESFWSELYGSTHNDHIKNLIALKQTELSKIVKLCIRVPHGTMSIRLASFISGLRAFTGYVGTNPNVTFKDIFTHAKDSELYKDVGLPEPYTMNSDGQYVIPSTELLREMMSTVYTEMHNVNSRTRMHSWDEFVKNIPKALTSNSAGIGAIRMTGKIDGSEVSIKTTSKAMIYPLAPSLFKPDKGMKIDMTNVDNFYIPFSVDNPGSMASRRVTAKPTRAVQMQPLAPYLLEYFMYAPLYRFYMRKNYTNYVFPKSTFFITDNGPVIDTNCMTLGTETGNPFNDHIDAFHLTGNAALRSKVNRRLIVDTDYTAYDETETSNNVRKPFRDGIIKGSKNSVPSGIYGPFDSIETIMHVLAPCVPAAYKVPNGDIVYLDGVRSGEYATMLINNSQNAALCGQVMETVQRMGFGTYEDIKIQGDDVRATLLLNPDNMELTLSYATDRDRILSEMTLGVDRVTALARVVSHVVKMCGQETNEMKGMVSYNVSDYLKIRIIGGRLSPNKYAQLFGSENVGMSDGPKSFMDGQLQKGDLIVSRGSDPRTVFRYSLMLHLLRFSFRVGIRNSDPDVSFIYYPPISSWFTPSSMGGVGRAPFMYPFPGDPAMGMWLKDDQVLSDYIQERNSSIKIDRVKDYTEIIAGLIISSDKRSDFKVTANLRPKNIDPKDLIKPFSKGISEMSSSLDISAIVRSRASMSKLESIGCKLISPKMKYENMPKRSMENVIRSNADVMEFAFDKSKTIGVDSFRDRKSGTISTSEKWLNSFTRVITDRLADEVHTDGPVCFLHPRVYNIMSQFGWGTTSSLCTRALTSMLNVIKSDPLFPRDITDDGLMRILFSTDVQNDPNIISDLLFAIGCSEDTVAEVVTMFNDSSMNTILLQYIAGSYSLNTPMFLLIDRSQSNMSRFVNMVSTDKVTKAAYAAMTSYWCMCSFKNGRPIHLSYEIGDNSIILMKGIAPLTIIPFVPILEADRLRNEDRVSVNGPIR
jgi:hypothetical protein